VYLNDQEKILTLLQRARERRTAVTEGKLPDMTTHTTMLPIESMDIGPIAETLFSHAVTHQELAALLATQSSFTFPKVAYLHSDIETLERSDILDDLRRGVYDVLVGINLLREGLDLPEVSLVAILDADKEGFLRSATSLVQTIGRAARHESGHVILYADRLTKSMRQAISETQRRRAAQIAYNTQHDITPTGIIKPIRERMITKTAEETQRSRRKRMLNHEEPKLEALLFTLSDGQEINITEFSPESLTPADRVALHKKLRSKMKQAADELDFELATLLRDAAQKLSELLD
jgi:excinuclease ABC subunit B